MLKCKVSEQLKFWEEADHKCLMVDGARQAGKTYGIRAFASEHYASVYELNSIENPDFKQTFSGSLAADRILMLLRLSLPDINFVEGNSLLFLDEAQECPEAISALKFLAGDKRFDVIASGSALGLAYNRSTSFPVGYVDYVDMYALDFEEFLWSRGVDSSIIDDVRLHFLAREKVHEAIHMRLMRLLTDYLIVGGMPEAVQSFVDSGDHLEADKVQRRLHRDYLSDIARFSTPDIKIKAEACYRSIPQQLLKENHKFQYSVVEKNGTARKFESSVDWLEMEHFVVSAKNVSSIEYPPSHFQKENNFRLYTTDIGM